MRSLSSIASRLSWAKLLSRTTFLCNWVRFRGFMMRDCIPSWTSVWGECSHCNHWRVNSWSISGNIAWVHSTMMVMMMMVVMMVLKGDLFVLELNNYRLIDNYWSRLRGYLRILINLPRLWWPITVKLRCLIPLSWRYWLLWSWTSSKYRFVESLLSIWKESRCIWRGINKCFPLYLLLLFSILHNTLSNSSCCSRAARIYSNTICWTTNLCEAWINSMPIVSDWGFFSNVWSMSKLQGFYFFLTS